MGRTYRTSSASSFGVSVLALAALTCIGVWAPTSPGGPPLWFAAPWLLGIGYGWWVVLCSLVYEIRLSDEGTCEFRSLLRTRRLRAQAIISVTSKTLEDGKEGVVRYQGGSISVWPLPKDFRDFLHRVEELNPTVQVDGF